MRDLHAGLRRELQSLVAASIVTGCSEPVPGNTPHRRLSEGIVATAEPTSAVIWCVESTPRLGTSASRFKWVRRLRYLIDSKDDDFPRSAILPVSHHRPATDSKLVKFGRHGVEEVFWYVLVRSPFLTVCK